MTGRQLNYILERDGFLYGMNVPWFDFDSYGCDIGSNFRRPVSNFKPFRVEEIFHNCKVIGINCVRIWLFEIMEGIRFDEEGYVTGFCPYFLSNLVTILETAKATRTDLIITFQPHISYSVSFPDEYNFYTKILREPEFTKTFLDNCVAPMGKLFSKYDNIIILDIYAEPEGDVTGPEGNYQKYGGTWEQMLEYIGSVADVLRMTAPTKPLTIASGWRKYDSLLEGRYINLDLDLIGIDIYDDKSFVLPADSLNTAGKPVWLAEFGPEDKDNWDENFYTENTLEFFNNAKKQGYIGAFLWMYGNKKSRESLTLVGKDNLLRPVATAMRSYIADNLPEGEQKSYLSSPGLLYIDSPERIECIPCKNANKYELERSEDLKKWHICDTKFINNSDDVERIVFCDGSPVGNLPSYYRVRAMAGDNEIIYSNFVRLSITKTF